MWFPCSVACFQDLRDQATCLSYRGGLEFWPESCWLLISLPLLLQNGLAEAPVNKSRKQIKERKNRTKKIRGVKKNAGMHPYHNSM